MIAKASLLTAVPSTAPVLRFAAIQGGPHCGADLVERRDPIQALAQQHELRLVWEKKRAALRGDERPVRAPGRRAAHAEADGLSLARRSPGVNVNHLAGDGCENLDPLSGMAFLSGIPVTVTPAESLAPAPP